MDGESKPLAFVDVDGVVLVFGTEEVMINNGAQLVQVGRIEQWVANSVAERLRVLEKHFECVWATAWFKQAPRDLAPVLGVGEDWPVLDWGDMKLPAILEWAGTRRFAFIDDDISFELRHFEGSVPDTGLLLDVSSSRGLTDDHVSELLAFAHNE